MKPLSLLTLVAVLLAALLSSPTYAAETLRLNSLFSDHMVLQRGVESPVWGTAPAGTEVTVTLDGPAHITKADANGRWQTKLSAHDAGGPYELTVKSGSNTITVKDVLIGDVWVCSGQSNMHWVVRQSMNYEQEQAAANYPRIREFKVPLKASVDEPFEDANAAWRVCSPGTVGNFSAVAYFFGRSLHQELDVPIGLLTSAYGGTPISAWMPPGQLEQIETAGPILERYDQAMQVYPALYAEYQQMQEKRQALRSQGNVEFADPGDSDAAAYANLDVDTTGWFELRSNMVEISGDSVVWARFETKLPKRFAGKTLEIRRVHTHRATSVDAYLNGVKIETAKSANGQQWTFRVPESAAKAGNVVLALRIYADTPMMNFFRLTPVFDIEGSWKSPVEGKGNWLLKAGASANDQEVHFALLPVMPVGPESPKSPTALYNAMIHPLQPYAIKGAAWYQGENNVSRAAQYDELLAAMIESWRAEWGQGDFPFLIVQLANYRKPGRKPGESIWAELREAQAKVAKQVDNAGLALVIDIGEERDIHPKNKQEVGRRLALAARAIAYGQDVTHAGPWYREMKVEGDKAIIYFDHTGSGLVANDGQLIRRFAIAGEDKVFRWANAKIEGDTVIVSHPNVPKPAAVRYAWDDNPEGANLYNKEGLPAVPFRTDDWPGVTDGNR